MVDDDGWWMIYDVLAYLILYPLHQYCFVDSYHFCNSTPSRFPASSLQTLWRVCVYGFIKLHITAQSGPVIYSFYATACNPPGGYLSCVCMCVCVCIY